MSLKKKFILSYLVFGVLFVFFVISGYSNLKKLENSIDANKYLKDLVSDIHLEHSYVNEYHNFSGRIFFDEHINADEVRAIKTELDEIVESEEMVCEQNVARLNKMFIYIDEEDYDELNRLILLFSEYDEKFEEYREMVGERIEELENGLFNESTGGYDEYVEAQIEINQIIEEMINHEYGGVDNGMGIDYFQNVSSQKIDKFLNNFFIGNFVLILVLISVFVVTVYYLSHRIVNPIVKIENAVNKIERDIYDVSGDLDIKNKDEIGDLAAGVASMAVSLRENQRKTEDIVKQIVNDYNCKMKKKK